MMRMIYYFLSFNLFFSISLFFFTPMAFGTEVLVEGVVAVVTTHKRQEVRQVIYLSDLKRYKIFFKPVGEKIDRTILLNRVINNRLLLPEARRFILEAPTKEAVADYLRFILRRFESKEVFQKALQKTGLSVDELKKEISDHLWVEKLIQERIKEFVFITPKAIGKYYGEHPDAFPERTLKEVEPIIEAILTGEKEKLKKAEYLNRLKEKALIDVLLRTSSSNPVR